MAFTALGADVTLVAPPTLLPPVARRLAGRRQPRPRRRARRRSTSLYLLRMQRERMTEALVPSLREYTTRFGLTAERAARLQRRTPW